MATADPRSVPLENHAIPYFSSAPPPPPTPLSPIPCGKYSQKKHQPPIENEKKEKKLAESPSVSMKVKRA